MVVDLVTVNVRGQIVIPKTVRKIINIQSDEKVVVFTHQKEGETCYMFLTEAGDFAEMANQFRDTRNF
jgi:AbrB family looped-hinge helix DNA binding protein